MKLAHTLCLVFVTGIQLSGKAVRGNDDIRDIFTGQNFSRDQNEAIARFELFFRDEITYFWKLVTCYHEVTYVLVIYSIYCYIYLGNEMMNSLFFCFSYPMCIYTMFL